MIERTNTHDVVARPKNDSRGGHMFHLRPGKVGRDVRREVERLLREEHGIDPADYSHEYVAKATIHEEIQGQDPRKPYKTCSLEELSVEV